MPTPIHKLFDQIHNVPQIPEVVRKIINELNNPELDMAQVAKEVEKEQVITLKILRLVNSAHFGLSRKIASIDDSIAMLGTNQLKTLVIASGLVCAMPRVDNLDIKAFWISSFRVANYAKWIAEDAQLATDISYTAGLLSNLGNILLHLGCPSEANEIDQHVRHGKSRHEFEKRRLGYTTAEVCAELCRRWKFSEELINAIEQSGDPLEFEPINKLAIVVYLSHFLSDCIDQKIEPQQILSAFPSQIAVQIGWSPDSIEAKIDQITAIKSDLDELLD